MVDGEPLRANEARVLIRTILESGTVTYSQPHALDRLRQRRMTMLDVENVLRSGRCAEAEMENGVWRYRMFTNRFEVIIEFLSTTELLIVTAWRIT